MPEPSMRATTKAASVDLFIRIPRKQRPDNKSVDCADNVESEVRSAILAACGAQDTLVTPMLWIGGA